MKRKNPLTFHGGPVIRTSIPKTSKKLRGLRPQPNVTVNVPSPDRSRVPSLSAAELRAAFELCSQLQRQHPFKTLSQCRHLAMSVVASKRDSKPVNLASVAPLAANQDIGREGAPAASLDPPNGCFEPSESPIGKRSGVPVLDTTGKCAVNDALVTHLDGVDRGSPHPIPTVVTT